MRMFGDLPPNRRDQKIAVILVEPQDPRNIGAVARAMSNLQYRDLRLVNPAKFDVTMAQSVACWGSDVVDSAQTYTSLEESVSDLHDIVGFASDSGQHRIPQLLLDQWIDRLPADSSYNIGLVFGSEEQGLRREHFPWCQYLVRIPSSGENRSYNLAQSVLLALYSLQKRGSAEAFNSTDERVDSKELGQYTEMVLTVAEKVGFLKMHSSHQIRELLINVARRSRLSTRELVILKGLFGTVLKNVGPRKM